MMDTGTLWVPVALHARTSVTRSLDFIAFVPRARRRRPEVT